MLTEGFFSRFGWPEHLSSATPFSIAHRGASDHATENTLKAFRLAAELGAHMWELDVRQTGDDVCVVHHDATLERVAGSPIGIADATADKICAVPLPEGQRVPTLTEVIALAVEVGCGLYIELKDRKSGPAALKELRQARFRFAAIGAFDPSWIADLRTDDCEYPLSVLVPRNADPVAYSAAARPDITHLCWLGTSERPDHLITADMVSRIAQTGSEIVTWHEDRPDVIAGLKRKPILGICSNSPEIVKSIRGPG